MFPYTTLRSIRIKTLAVVFGAVVGLTLITVSNSKVFRLVNVEAGTPQTAKAKSTTVGCCGGDEANKKEHLLGGSYYTLKNGFSAKLMLNNKGPVPIEVQPTLFNMKGARFTAPVVVVNPTSHLFIDLGDWVAVAGDGFREGSVQLYHLGKDLVLGTQLYLTDETHSIGFEEKLTELGRGASSRLEGVWWLPSPNGELELVLSNTTDGPLSVTTKIRGEEPKREAEVAIDLMPHETRILSGQRLLTGKEHAAMSSFGAISVAHNGSPGAVLARAMAADKSVGFSLPIQFSDPGGGKSRKLQGAGLRLGRVTREPLSPKIVVHNAGETATSLTGRVPYTMNDGSTGEATLPPIELPPHETRVIDVSESVEVPVVRRNLIVSAGLELEYTGQLGSVITSAFSVSRSGSQVFRVPLWDIEAQRSATGGYPWYLEGDSSTVIYIKNVTAEPQHYRMYLKHSDGDYVFPRGKVAPGQTIVVDVRQLRDAQVADENGKPIPLHETQGQVQWSMTGGVDRVLIGRAEQVDISNGISSNYACQNCCGNSFFDGWLTPVESTGYTDYQLQFTAWQRDTNCYGQLYPPYPADIPYYSAADESVCDPDFSGTTTGITPGTTVIYGGWTANSWFLGLNEYCEYTPVEVVRDAFCEVLARRVDDVSPGRALIGQPVDVTITGSGFGNGTPTVSAGSGITVSNVQLINGGEIRARFTSATNAGGNHAVSVTTSLGQTTTIPGNFFVQIPSQFFALVLSQANLNCPSGTVGFGAAVQYQLADQAGEPIPFAGLTPQEHFTVTDSSGTHDAFPGFLPFATPATTDSLGQFLDTPVGTCFLPSPQNGCIVRRQTFNIVVGSITYDIPTVTSSCDCIQGLGIRVVNGTSVGTSTLGTTNCS